MMNRSPLCHPPTGKPNLLNTHWARTPPPLPTTLTSPPTIRLVFLDTLPGATNKKRHSSLFGFGNTHTTDPSPTEKNTSSQVFWDPIRDMTCDMRPEEAAWPWSLPDFEGRIDANGLRKPNITSRTHLRPHQPESTASRPLSEVKQVRVRLVVRFVRTCEVRML
jgi:hypothetical protein